MQGTDNVWYIFRASATYLSLLKIAESGKRFRVIVVDSKPHLEGRNSLLPQLRAAGINCSYIHINAIGYIMKEVVITFDAHDSQLLDSCLGHENNSGGVLHL